MSDARTILLVDDDASVRDAASDYLRRAGFAVTAVPDGREALRRIESERFRLIISDLRMPGMSGLDLLKATRSRGRETPFILLTAFGSIETAVDSMKHGARDFLSKPFAPAQLERAIRECLAGERKTDSPRPDAPPDHPTFVANSRPMRELVALAEQVAGSRATLLIMGESGTGKEVLARYIHARGTGGRSPFVAMNCAAVPDGLLESEMFGHEKGAFTGAATRRIGRFEHANGGTILLDEIGEMDLRLQAKLLRVLQEKTFERVGGSTPVSVRLRVMATTNRDLREAVRNGVFREDLFFRLNVVPLLIPPLRDRREDILPLTEHFAETFAAEHGGPKPVFQDAAREYLLGLPYPGNVRELMNRVERAVLLTPGGEIGPRDLDEPGPAPAPPAPNDAPVPSVREMEKSLIFQALSSTAGNRSRAAAVLGISVRTLRNKLHEYEIRGEAVP